MQNKQPIYAGFFVRVAAYVIDWLIVGVALLMLRIPFGILSMTSANNILVRDFIFQYSISDIVIYLLGCTYFIVMTYMSGSTIGKRVLHLKVVSVDEEQEKLTLLNVIYRETIGRFLSGVIMEIGYLLVAIDKEKRGLHDILCDTRVVYEHPKPSYVMPQQPMMQRPTYNPATGMLYPGNQEVRMENQIPEQTENEKIETEITNEASEND